MPGIGAQTWQALIDGKQVTRLTDWLDLSLEDLGALPGFAKKRSTHTAQAFTRAQRQPFKVWLKALGAPPVVTPKATDNWHSLAALSEQDWQQQRYFSLGNAQRARAFFQHPELQTIAIHLQRHGIDGFQMIEQILAE